MRLRRGSLNVEQAKLADVAIEFTQPDAAADNITELLTAGVPVVSGTTGWLEAKNKVDQIASSQAVGFVYASNFSLGVNLFFAFNEKLASMMNEYKDYQPRIHEIHHTGKKDEPSGTAITAAEGILKAYPALDGWTMDSESKGLPVPLVIAVLIPIKSPFVLTRAPPLFPELTAASVWIND